LALAGDALQDAAGECGDGQADRDRADYGGGAEGGGEG
jgi:hypothetical protein